MVTKQKYLKLIKRRKALQNHLTLVKQKKIKYQSDSDRFGHLNDFVIAQGANKKYLSLKREYNDVNDLIQAYKTIRKIQIGNIALISIKVDGE